MGDARGGAGRDASTNFLSVGSALHSEAVAVRVGALPGWTADTFKAVHAWPERLDLWAEWERLATNAADPHRGATAAVFYAAHRAEMDRGARVYWPAKWPLAELMLKRAEIGAAAFDGEYQGVPNLGGLAVWPAEMWDDAPGRPFWFDHFPESFRFAAVALDPSGGGVDGDYQAVVFAGIDRQGDWWLDCDLDRDHPTAMVSRTLRLARQWPGVGAVTVEENSTLGLLRAEFEQQTKGQVLPFGVDYLTSTDGKEDRILDGIGKYLARGRVRVRRSRGGQKLAEQGRQFPHADHDDALDAASVAVRRVEERLLRGR